MLCIIPSNLVKKKHPPMHVVHVYPDSQLRDGMAVYKSPAGPHCIATPSLLQLASLAQPAQPAQPAQSSLVQYIGGEKYNIVR